MGVRITDTSNVALYDSVTGWTLGPVFNTVYDAESFLAYLDGNDPRDLTPVELVKKHREWVEQQT